MERRNFLALAATAAAILLPRVILSQSSRAVDAHIDIDKILQGSEQTTVGNPTGDAAIVAFSDYNCPFCKAADRDLEKFTGEDGSIRLIYKEWPILSTASVYGARIALAAAHQGKYLAAHRAMMSIPGTGVTESRMLIGVESAGVDVELLHGALRKHADIIDALLKRNDAQARELGLAGTPSYLIGSRLYNTLDYAGFREAVANARQSAAQNEAS